MKKSLICLVLVLVMLMLCACGAEEPKIEIPDMEDLLADVTTAPQEEEETEPEQTEAPTEPEETEVPVEPITVEEMDIRDISVTVTKVGTMANKDNLSFASDMPVTRVYEDEVAYYTLYSYMGEDLMGKTYNNFEYFVDGITAAYTYSEEVPQCSLINVNTGETYLEDEACQIEQLSDRFYYVIYATEQTEDKDEAFIYFTDNMFSIAPDEDDILYKGYAKIFDLEAGDFVGDIVLNEPNDVTVCENTTLCVEVDWDTCDVYAADGTCLAEGVPTVTVCQDIMVQDTYEGIVIYDSEFNKLRELSDGDIVSEEGSTYTAYSNKYLKTYNSDEYPYLYGLTDMGGNLVLDTKYESIYKTYGDYVFVGMKKDDQYLYGVNLADGTEIIPCEYRGAYVMDRLPLIRYYDYEDNDFIYIPGVGSINEGEYKKDSDVYYNLVNEDDYSTCNYLVYGTGETVTYTDADVITGVLLFCEDGLMEMINGEILVDAEEFNFDRVISTSEYLYCYDRAAGEYTIYRYEIG